MDRNKSVGSSTGGRGRESGAPERDTLGHRLLPLPLVTRVFLLGSQRLREFTHQSVMEVGIFVDTINKIKY